MRELWRKRDVARYLGVSERTVERLQREAGLPHLKPFGPGRGTVRYDPARVAAWRQSREHGSVPGLRVLAGGGSDSLDLRGRVE